MSPVTKAELETRFTYHVPKEGQGAKYEAIRHQAKRFAEFIVAKCPESREQSVALTELDEVVFWANASIARREKEALTPGMLEAGRGL